MVEYAMSVPQNLARRARTRAGENQTPGEWLIANQSTRGVPDDVTNLRPDPSEAELLVGLCQTEQERIVEVCSEGQSIDEWVKRAIADLLAEDPGVIRRASSWTEVAEVAIFRRL
jgi:hypothetical protein